jgi:hypothetical protein
MKLTKNTTHPQPKTTKSIRPFVNPSAACDKRVLVCHRLLVWGVYPLDASWAPAIGAQAIKYFLAPCSCTGIVVVYYGVPAQ